MHTVAALVVVVVGGVGGGAESEKSIVKCVVLETLRRSEDGNLLELLDSPPLQSRSRQPQQSSLQPLKDYKLFSQEYGYYFL